MLVLHLLSLLLAVAVLTTVGILERRRDMAPQCIKNQCVEIYEFLVAEGEAHPSDPLLELRPRGRDLRRLGEVLFVLAESFVECRPERVRLLSVVWGVERRLLGRVESGSARAAAKAMEQLLGLYPSFRATATIENRHFHTSRTRLLQLLVNIYAKPSQVVALLKAHPHRLSWGEMERVVEVLKRRCPILERVECDGAPSHNTELFELYLAQVEGVGSAEEVARRLALSSEGPLRSAASNALWRERLFPRYGTFGREPRG